MEDLARTSYNGFKLGTREAGHTRLFDAMVDNQVAQRIKLVIRVLEAGAVRQLLDEVVCDVISILDS